VFPPDVPLTAAAKDMIDQIFQVAPNKSIDMDGIFKHPSETWFQSLPVLAARREYALRKDFSSMEKHLKQIMRSANPSFLAETRKDREHFSVRAGMLGTWYCHHDYPYK